MHTSSEDVPPASDDAAESGRAFAGKLVRVLAGLSPAQIAFSPLHAVRALAHRQVVERVGRAGVPAHFRGRLFERSELDAPIVGLDAELARADRALAGRHLLHGREVDFSCAAGRLAPLQWERAARLELAALDVVRSLSIASACAAYPERERARSLADEHVREVLAVSVQDWPEAWEPQLLAARFFNLLYWRELSESPHEASTAGLLARHARLLFATLELERPSTRLPEQAAALWVASCLLDTRGAGAWQGVARRILEHSVVHDILPDGGHVTRSATLGAQYLARLLFVLAASIEASVQPPAGVESAASRLARHLMLLAHPGGQPVSFRDSCETGAPWPVDLAGALALAPGPTLHGALLGTVARVPPLFRQPFMGFDDSGALAITDRGTHLALIYGPPGAGDAGAHAHADFGAFELSQNGVILLREPGAGTFAADEWRDYVRSPRARTALSVGGEGVDELWGGFLVGRKARRGCAYQAFDGGHVVRVEALAAGGWRQERLVVLLPGRLCAVFERVVEPPEGAQVVSWVQLDEQARVSLCSTGVDVELVGRRWRLETMAGAPPVVVQGQHAPLAGWRANTPGRFVQAPAIAFEAVRVGRTAVAGWAMMLSDKARVECKASGAFNLENEVVVTLDASGLRWRRA